MRILMLNYEFPPLGGGAANANYYLLKELAKKENINIDLVTSSTNKFRIEQFSNNIKIHFLDIGKNGNLHHQTITDLLNYSIKSYKYGKTLINKQTFDLTFAFFGIPCGYIAMKLGLPYIVSLRGSDVPFHTPKYKWFDILLFKRLSKTIWKNSAFTVANSQGLKEEAIASAPNQHFEVIYNGIDTNKFFPNKTKNNTFTIITTGRLAKHKGSKILLEAIKGLENIQLIFVGDGPLKEELIQLAKKWNIDTLFTGKLPQNEMIPILQKSDVFVLPSLNEGMSNSMLEAMACGLPIIATNVGGALELVKGNGFIVEKGSPSVIKEAIKKYISNPELASKHGNKSRKIAESLSWKNMANNYLKLCEKCVE